MSKIMASSAISSKFFGPNRRSVMQEFSFGKKVFKGTCKGFYPYPQRASFSQESNHAIHDNFLFWNENVLFECKNLRSSEDIFMELLNHSERFCVKVEELAEPFGKTVGLDLLRLYEDAADHHFKKGDYGKASQ